MPAPGDQHLNTGGGMSITNPFEEVKHRISEYTALEIATLQSRLEKQLGPEYISSRLGPSGQKVHYLAAEKCIQLANEVFGFNGWSSQIMDVTVDFVDENTTTGKVSLGLSVTVRVTLRDGTFHEDIGYGHMENSKGKATAFEKAKKEGTTDGLKRALRNFGNVLGNCIYDKEYLKQITKVKIQPAKWDSDNLHRHSTYAIKREPIQTEPISRPMEQRVQSRGRRPSLLSEETFEDEFGEFDEADFSVADTDAHPDEVVLTEPPISTSQHFNGVRNGNGNSSGTNTPKLGRPPMNRAPKTTAPITRPAQTSTLPNNPPQPQTPNNGFARSTSGAAQAMRPPPDPKPAPLQLNPVAGRVLNQPSRNGPPSAPPSPVRHPVSSDDDFTSLPLQGAGFFSARAAANLIGGDQQVTDLPPIPKDTPAFNLHAESPSIRKTPGIDHNVSKPLSRDLKPVPASSQGAAAPAPGGPRPGNPQMESFRKIGAPGGGSPMLNRGAYKPPSIKRPLDNGNGLRIPLVDLPANGAIASELGAGGDVKRQRLNG